MCFSFIASSFACLLFVLLLLFFLLFFSVLIWKIMYNWMLRREGERLWYYWIMIKYWDGALCKRFRSVRRSQQRSTIWYPEGITPNAHVKFINKSSVVRGRESRRWVLRNVRPRFFACNKYTQDGEKGAWLDDVVLSLSVDTQISRPTRASYPYPSRRWYYELLLRRRYVGAHHTIVCAPPTPASVRHAAQRQSNTNPSLSDKNTREAFLRLFSVQRFERGYRSWWWASYRVLVRAEVEEILFPRFAKKVSMLAKHWRSREIFVRKNLRPSLASIFAVVEHCRLTVGRRQAKKKGKASISFG